MSNLADWLFDQWHLQTYPCSTAVYDLARQPGLQRAIQNHACLRVTSYTVNLFLFSYNQISCPPILHCSHRIFFFGLPRRISRSSSCLASLTHGNERPDPRLWSNHLALSCSMIACCQLFIQSDHTHVVQLRLVQHLLAHLVLSSRMYALSRGLSMPILRSISRHPV